METEIPKSEIERAAAAAPPPPPAPPAPAPQQQAAPAAAEETAAPAAADSSKVMDQEWPYRGYVGPQPWEAENTPELTQNHLMLSSGSAGEEVQALADLLGTLGYSTSVSHGQNPALAFDETVSAAVRAFCSEFGVAEDPTVLRARTDDTVGPWIWEALTRASNKAAAEQG